MPLASDDFALFELPRRFALDPVELGERRRLLQAQVHPDRFASEGAQAQRMAMQWAVRVNEAWERLREPLKRAAYLCELNGAPIRAEDNTAMPVEFLVQQMEWREALDDAGTALELSTLAERVQRHREAAHAGLAMSLDERRDFVQAAEQVRALMFVERFADDLRERLERLEA